jgi:NADH:ubiquinone oxidoreductase subunit E
VEKFQSFIKEQKLENEIELAGTFCMGNCQKGVSVTIDDMLFSVSPETAQSFFEDEVLKRVSI